LLPGVTLSPPNGAPIRNAYSAPVTGEIVAAHDGHVVNQGNVKLLDADDKSEVETGKLERPDGKFHLFFVPEGNILHVDTAADVTYEDVPSPPAPCRPPTK
jgi:hypothetical protein